ncbi:MAG: site-specific DNA-methyltransferase [Pirellulales bacterium]|nr:site-specific DNA-methyltransferase [Pirellulales bacterium]
MTTTPCNQRLGRDHRTALENHFHDIIEPNPRLDRRLVSHQANRDRPFYDWFKYKEAFSAALVEHFLGLYGQPGGTFLDPFAGIGTALFVAQNAGMAAHGIELMPVGYQVGAARIAARSIRPTSFAHDVLDATNRDWNGSWNAPFALKHIPITTGAFPDETEQAIAAYRAYCAQNIRNRGVRTLFQLAGMAVLESVSFTRKDGQYLRWDYRANKKRALSRFDKGKIQRFGPAVTERLHAYMTDLSSMPEASCPNRQNPFEESSGAVVDFRQGSCLHHLPRISSNSIDLVMTSPPYCNRYDYTRTYALELVYLGYDADSVKRLRQRLLSCTVENRQKRDELVSMYTKNGTTRSCDRVLAVFEHQQALHEVLSILKSRAREGRLNNLNIPRMVTNYFLEMCFVVHELARILRRGGRIVMVNDNVRYAGEEVPADIILSDFAQAFGLQIEHIWTLPRGKGNSSQQMGHHGRAELRKCVYVWQK